VQGADEDHITIASRAAYHYLGIFALIVTFAPAAQFPTMLISRSGGSSPFDYWMPEAEAAARSLAIELLPSRVESAVDIERAIESVASAPNGGLVLPPDTFTTSTHFDLILVLTTRYRLLDGLQQPPIRYGGRSDVLRD
jgi:hypothetical protein